MLQMIIAKLGIVILMTATPNISCKIDNPDVGGCYYKQSNEIIISGTKDTSTNEFILGHEIGHALFLGNKQLEKMVNDYPEIRYYPRSIYNTQLKVNQEKIADYFAMYAKSPSDFKVFSPEIYQIFNNKIKNL